MNEKQINETLDALRFGVCTLIYTKLDGEIRQATGTLNPHLIPGEFHPKVILDVIKKELDPNLIHYFDLGSNGWRCFWLENLQSLSVNV
jgi:hypothetical protein